MRRPTGSSAPEVLLSRLEGQYRREAGKNLSCRRRLDGGQPAPGQACSGDDAVGLDFLKRPCSGLPPSLIFLCLYALFWIGMPASRV